MVKAERLGLDDALEFLDTGLKVLVGSGWEVVGSDGLRNNGGDNRLQRCFRDLQTGAIHRHVDHNIAIDSASVLLGVNGPDLPI